MRILKNAAAVLLCLITLSAFFIKAGADGMGRGESVTTDAEAGQEEQLDVKANSYILCEASTGTVLLKSNENEKKPISHLTKLMTILLTAEELQKGKDFTLDKNLTASSHANSMQGSQIWLAAGEKISVKELLMSVTIGNANDACVVLAEALGQSEDGFVSMMNSRAKTLGMSNTKYVDSTGMSDDNISTAYDISLLCRELLKYDFLQEYFCTWMADVRNGQAELVNLNTLVKGYKGITGLKACASEKAGNCIAASAKRDNMSVVAVALDSEKSDYRAADAETLMDYGFSAFEMFSPEIPAEALEPVKIVHGVEGECDVEIDGAKALVLKRGESPAVEIEFERSDQAEAPVEKGIVVGNIKYLLDGREILKQNIITCEKTERINIKKAFTMLLFKLLGVD